ncbi:MAG TPA: hypothetical protein VFW33_13835 [Gemmataceae bacterium]|nr:hypothetical protein [Gemmataceae bacterium]
MPVIVACPKCLKKLQLADNLLGKQIKCPGCATVFMTKAPGGAAPPPAKTAPAAPKAAPPAPKAAPAPAPRKAAPPPDDEDEAPRRPAKKAPLPDEDDEDVRPAKKPAARAPRDEDDEDDRPVKKSAAKKSRTDDDDEDDRPRKSSAKKGRAAVDDDDDDDRPAKKAKKKGGSGKLLIILGVLGLFLCGGCGGGGYYVYTQFVEGVKNFATGVEAEMNKLPPDVEDTKGPLTKAKPATFPAEWKEFKQDKYGFSVMLPGTPKPGPLNGDTTGEFELPVPANQAGAGVKSGYWIKVGDYPGADGAPFMTNAVLEQMLGEAQGHVGGMNPATKKKAGTIAGKPGRSCTLQDPKGGIWYCRACLAGTRGYILVAGWEPKVAQTDADLFFDSFELK